MIMRVGVARTEGSGRLRLTVQILPARRCLQLSGSHCLIPACGKHACLPSDSSVLPLPATASVRLSASSRAASAAGRCQACLCTHRHTHVLVPATHLLHQSVHICLVLPLILSIQVLSVLTGLTVSTRLARHTVTAVVRQADWVVHQPLAPLWPPMLGLTGYRTGRACQPAPSTSIRSRSGPKSRGSRVCLAATTPLIPPATASNSRGVRSEGCEPHHWVH